MARFRVVSRDSPVTIDAVSTMHPVHATSTQLTGTIEVELDGSGAVDLASPHAAHLVLPVESLSSGHGVQDREMRRRLDTKRHPTITVDVAEATPADGGRLRASARVTVRGQTEALDGEVSLSVDGDRLVVEGEKRVDMRTFGIDPPRLLILKVEPEVTVRVRITADRESSAE